MCTAWRCIWPSPGSI
ncbi:GM19528 [Drosophila sechellia]|uniref:GM19528 n=1 Tax=Drosophila sechellia TaxID=7238 RepID=B4I4T5_DROSE|nr:GM19528 [Drosophila sechellia]